MKHKNISHTERLAKEIIQTKSQLEAVCYVALLCVFVAVGFLLALFVVGWLYNHWQVALIMTGLVAVILALETRG